MSKFAALADRLLARVVPEVSASACGVYYRWSTCYCSGGLRYARGCQYCYPYSCPCTGLAVACPGNTGCRVVGTC